MTSLAHAALADGGVVTRQRLEANGFGEADIRALLRRGALRRIRHGWYAMACADALVVRAVTAGGVLTCSESGTETMVRLRLRSKNIIVATQHHVPGVGYVDLLVGDRLVIEVDSKAHHTGVERYEADRTRDRRLVQLGYLPLRFTYRQVVHGWADCEHTIDDLIRRREHHRHRRDRR